MQFDDVHQQAAIDLERFIPSKHFLLRGHTPQAYSEIVEQLLSDPRGITRRELAAVKSIATWVKCDGVARKIFAELATNCGDAHKDMTEEQRLEIDAREHNAREAAHTYAKHVGDPLLIEAWPLPVWMPGTKATNVAHKAFATESTLDRVVQRHEQGEKAPNPCVSMKKEALINLYKVMWPGIEGDISDAYRNGLAEAAKAGKRGWREADALEWARNKNRLITANEANHALTTVMHRMATK